MRRIVAGVLRREGRILICQRALGSVQGMLWEFPGGKLEPGEDERSGLVRELREELGIDAEVGKLLLRLRHRYSETGELELAFYEIDSFNPAPVNRVFACISWEEPAKLVDYDFLAADRPLLELLSSAKLP